jgi:multisubunit Na+/H+ antiporter MnhG subunit
MTPAGALAAVLLVAGLAVLVLCCAGVATMRAALDRLHYTGPAGLGALLVAAALVAGGAETALALKAVLLAAFLLVTQSVLTHLTARAVRIQATRWDDG